MIRGTRPLLIVLASASLPGAPHAQNGLALSPPAATSEVQPGARSKVGPRTRGSHFRKAESDNAAAMRWTCVGCTDRPRRAGTDDLARPPDESGEPVIVDPAQAPVID